jgi:hypothetical protein
LGFGFFVHEAVAVAAVVKWESRAVGEISKQAGKVRFGTFPACVFSTAPVVVLRLRDLPWLV